MGLETESLITHLLSGCFTVKSLSYKSDPLNLYVNSDGLMDEIVDYLVPPFFIDQVTSSRFVDVYAIVGSTLKAC